MTDQASLPVLPNDKTVTQQPSSNQQAQADVTNSVSDYDPFARIQAGDEACAELKIGKSYRPRSVK